MADGVEMKREANREVYNSRVWKRESIKTVYINGRSLSLSVRKRWLCVSPKIMRTKIFVYVTEETWVGASIYSTMEKFRAITPQIKYRCVPRESLRTAARSFLGFWIFDALLSTFFDRQRMSLAESVRARAMMLRNIMAFRNCQSLTQSNHRIGLARNYTWYGVEKVQVVDLVEKSSGLCFVVEAVKERATSGRICRIGCTVWYDRNRSWSKNARNGLIGEHCPLPIVFHPRHRQSLGLIHAKNSVSPYPHEFDSNPLSDNTTNRFCLRKPMSFCLGYTGSRQFSLIRYSIRTSVQVYLRCGMFVPFWRVVCCCDRWFVDSFVEVDSTPCRCWINGQRPWRLK